MKALLTGAAGFIGYHVCEKLLARGEQVTGIDNLNNYYDVNLKHARLDRLKKHTAFTFIKTDIADRSAMQKIFEHDQFDVVVNLAAQAGVRYSLENPAAYIDSNLVGFGNILEGCRHQKVKHLVFASSSSVYGANKKVPFSESDNVDHPIALYAASKKANELMAHSYAYLYQLPCTGLRFFTVYGPWGRPDMALFKFTKNILAGKPIDVYNHGDMLRDFTYIDDIVEGVTRVIDRPPPPCETGAPYEIYNIGNNQPVKLLDFITAIEKTLGMKAIKNMLPLQPGDAPKTYADTTKLQKDFNYKPQTTITEGIEKFIAWYRVSTMEKFPQLTP